MTATNVRRPDMVRRKSLRATKEKVNGKIIWLFRKGSGFESLRSRFSALESTNNNATLIVLQYVVVVEQHSRDDHKEHLM